MNNIEIVKKVLLWAESGLVGALALKVFGVQIIQSWGAWWLLQIVVMLVFAVVFIQENKVEMVKILEDLAKKTGGNG